jgi:hypothetical protein
MQSLLGPLPPTLASYLVSLGLPREVVTSRKAATRSLSSLVSLKGGMEAADFVAKMVVYDAGGRSQAWAGLPQHPYLNPPQTDMSRTRAAAQAAQAEHEGKLAEALRLLLGRSVRLNDHVLAVLQGSKASAVEGVDTELARVLGEAPLAQHEQFAERFLPVARPEEKVRLLELLHAQMADAVAPRMATAREWVAGKVNPAEAPLGEVVEELDAKHGPPGRAEKRLCESCAALAGLLHADMAAGGVDDVAAMHASPANALMACLSAPLLAEGAGYSAKRASLEKAMALLGLHAPLDHPHALSPSSKGLLLHMRQLDSGLVRLPVVLSRDTALREIFECMRKSGAARLRRNSMPGAQLSIFLPYFRSEYGQKVGGPCCSGRSLRLFVSVGILSLTHDKRTSLNVPPLLPHRWSTGRRWRRARAWGRARSSSLCSRRSCSRPGRP